MGKKSVSPVKKRVTAGKRSQIKRATKRPLARSTKGVQKSVVSNPSNFPMAYQSKSSLPNTAYYYVRSGGASFNGFEDVPKHFYSEGTCHDDPHKTPSWKMRVDAIIKGIHFKKGDVINFDEDEIYITVIFLSDRVVRGVPCKGKKPVEFRYHNGKLRFCALSKNREIQGVSTKAGTEVVIENSTDLHSKKCP